MTKEQLKKELLTKPSYFKKGKNWIADKFGTSLSITQAVLDDLRAEKKDYTSNIPSRTTGRKRMEELYNKILDKNPDAKVEYIPKKEQVYKGKPFKKGDPDNVLFIGDLHSPFTLEEYLDFNVDLQKKYNAGTIIFAGDIIDGHSWSFHTHDADGMSVHDELKAAISCLKSWYKAFPEASVLYGNHDLLIIRKARDIGLSKLFLKHFGDIIEAPKTWNFTDEIYKDKVLYVHGSIGNAIKRATDIRHSVAQGHLHSQAFVEWSVSEIDAIFGLQVGCGIDRRQYAFEYAEPMTKKPIISSGLVLDKGRLPIIELAKL